MEFLNRMEIRGVVGRAEYSSVGNGRVARFSVVTDYNYRRDGAPVTESTWFNIRAWEGRSIPDLGQLAKGSWVHVIGRVRTYKYVTPDGEERTNWEVTATRVKILEPEDDMMQPQHP
jgi:single-stranded DNA-binding protein